jgi:D-glycero-alpha-D-manno-heptose-7-phosphate kinase
MKKVTVRAPVRADLAGGTLDLWPLWLFHPGARTINVAISYYAESQIEEISGGGIEIDLTDSGYQQRYNTLHELAADPKAALLYRILEHFHTVDGIRITTRTDAPRGSGLGGSSALSVTIVRAISELAGEPVEGDQLIALVRDLETRLLGVPAGIQDYYPPVYGGLAALHLEPGTVRRHEIPLPIDKLGEHFVMHYTGVAHFSGTNNWEMYKRQIDGKKKVHRGFDKIRDSAIEMEKALESGDMKAAGAALAHEWTNRKALIKGISTPEIDAAIAAATGAGAWAGKVCGAGGGGCIVFLMPPDRKDDVKRALAEVPGRTLECVPVPHGLAVETVDDAQTTLTFDRVRHTPRGGNTLEQLYAYVSRRGGYRPFLVAEAVSTLAEPKSGQHQTIVRTYATPVDERDGSVKWNEALSIDPNTLDLRAVPDEKRQFATKIDPEILTQAAAQAEEGFRQFVVDNEKMRVYSNPRFGLYSESHETREAFLARCLEEAKRRVEDEGERLEGSFRRRLDQVKERSERDTRELDDKEETTDPQRRQDVNVAWGQALYNITSGKPAAVVEAPSSVREGDYLEKIAQIQRAWDRELEAIRDGLNAQAREIEEILVTPNAKSIDISRYLIVWAPRLG